MEVKYKRTFRITEAKRRKVKLSAQDYLFLKVVGEKQICKEFGCGRELRSQELLSGNYCIHHQKKEKGVY